MTGLLRITGLIGALAMLAACSGERDISLRSFQNVGGGPEEFAILPNKPLERPDSFRELPQPTPGAANRADLTPNSDAVAALGGSPAALVPTTSVPSNESTLVAYAGRQGRDPGIRQTLATEDEAFRRRQSLFTKIRLFKVDRYYEAYNREDVNARRQQRIWRNAGAPTPTAPPPGYR